MNNVLVSQSRGTISLSVRNLEVENGSVLRSHLLPNLRTTSAICQELLHHVRNQEIVFIGIRVSSIGDPSVSRNSRFSNTCGVLYFLGSSVMINFLAMARVLITIPVFFKIIKKVLFTSVY